MTIQASELDSLAARYLRFAGRRTLYRIGNDLTPPALQHFPLTLEIYENGQMTAHHPADVDGHDRWLQ